MQLRKFLFLLIPLCTGIIPLKAQHRQDWRTTDTFLVRPDNQYFLRAVSIVPGSEEVYLRRRLVRREDYRFNYIAGSFRLSDSLFYSLFDTIIVRYSTLPLSLKKEYWLHKLIAGGGRQPSDTAYFSVHASEPLTTESIFGRNLERSGTLIRGFTAGSNRDLTLQSGFQLQLSGKLSDDIEVVAALSDENSPIQPEGNTERLDEVDKVFIQLKHKNGTALLGDYEFTGKNGEFGNISRKLQGISADVNIGATKAAFAYASSRGKFNSNSMNGQDAVQGPYLLFGTNNEKDIIIIAGSERVYLDGVLMKRGEQNDYTIDYGNAQLTFTTRRVITNASRIIVEFEYTDRQFKRSFFGAGVSTLIWDEKIKIGTQFIREGDDEDSPIDISLSDSDKTVLRDAGDNRAAARRSGISLAPPDSNNIHRGLYEKIDTVISGTPITFYRYQPGAAGAEYFVSFNYAGEGAGDYFRDAPGKFRFAGIGKGNYSTGIFLPLPQLKMSGNIFGEMKIEKLLSMNVELAASSLDRNKFSALDDNDNTGGAASFIIKFEPVNLANVGVHLGMLSASWKERYIQSRYTPVDRIGDVEYARNYNLQTAGTKADEHLREIEALYSPVNGIEISGLYGGVRRGSDFSSNRYRGTANVKKLQGFDAKYDVDYVASGIAAFTSTWLRQSGELAYEFAWAKPMLQFRQEKKADKRRGDSLLAGSLRYIELEPRLELKPFSSLQVSLDGIHRADETTFAGKWIREAVSSGYGFSLSLVMPKVNSSFRLSVRDKKYSEHFLTTGQSNTQMILVKSQTRVSPLAQFTADLYYETATQKTSLLDRVYVQVTKGLGTHRYIADLNDNGIKEEFEFEPVRYDGEYLLVTVPSDKLYPVIDLKTSIRLRWNLQQILNPTDFLQQLMNPFTFETYGRIEENSREQALKRIYLLDLNAFQQEAATIRGNNVFQQTVYLFENSSEFSGRYFFSQGRSLNQYGSGFERGTKIEQQVRVRFQLVKEIANQTDVTLVRDDMASKANTFRNRNIEGSSLTTDFSYRPFDQVETGFTLKTGRNTDRFPQKPTTIDENSQQIHVNVSLAGMGRVRLEGERVELQSSESGNYLPYELTGGNGVGKNYFIRLNFDYRISSNLQATANYDGRSISGSKLIHTFRAEARAFF